MTKRDQEVLDLLMEIPVSRRRFADNGERKSAKILCNTNRSIGAKLGIAERTVKMHIARIARAWGIEDHFLPRVRIVYLESVRRGLIPILDKAEVLQ